MFEKKNLLFHTFRNNHKFILNVQLRWKLLKYETHRFIIKHSKSFAKEREKEEHD